VATDAELREILERCRSIAVVGFKIGEAEESERVARYLHERGYRILPVNPRLAGVEALGERIRASLTELEEPVDLVDLFRAPRHLPAHVDEILALAARPGTVWMQLGIREPRSAARLREAGLRVVEDRCLMVEHRRLLGGP
jgi:uncharacterized protein